PTTTRSLQQLWELSKLSDKVDLATKRDMKEASEGRMSEDMERRLDITVKRLCDCNEFMSINKLLKAYDQFLQNNEKAPCDKVVGEVLWAAALAKSMGTLPPSILDWIEKAIRRIPEPIPMKKEQMIWLLSI
ncbi:hypothetical protein PENTCL1PPCAC_21862, partial [Pristionchus entomophagus]